MPNTSPSAAALQVQSPRCKLLKNLEARGLPPFSRSLREDADFEAVPLVLDFNFSGEIPMRINDKAPDFTLQDENGKEIALKNLRGKTVVLYFYPRANTPG